MKLKLNIHVPDYHLDQEVVLTQLLKAAIADAGITITVPGRGNPSTGAPQGTHIDVDLIDVERVG